MNDTDSDVGDEIEEINEDDVEEVIDINDLTLEEGDNPMSDEEDQNNTSSSPPPARDDSDYVFTKHTGPVFCCALDPKNGNLAVTGGQDDKCFIWEIQSGQVIFEEGFFDSVTAVLFSCDGAYLAIGDMSGSVQVWRLSTQDLISTMSIGEFTWLEWHHGTNVLLCGLPSGELYIWRIPDTKCKVIYGHTSIVCGVVMPDGRRVALGYKDGVVKVFEIKSGSVQGTVTTGEAQKSVACIDNNFDNNIIATGGEDGVVTIIKSQPPVKVLWSYNCAHSDDKDPYIESIGFSKDQSLPLLAAGMLGMIHILDFSKQVVRHKCVLESGISRLLWDPHSLMMYVGCLDGVLRVYDGRSGTLQSELHGHKDTILNIFLSADGNTLLSVSDDATCRVFLVSPPER